MDTFREMEWLLEGGGEGPMWTREVARGEYSRERLENMMSVLGAKKLIIGHSPTEERIIQSLYNGKVFNIDTGISRAIARGNLSAMVFKKNGQVQTFNKIHRKTYHPVAHAIRTRFLPKYNDAARRKSWGCFAEVALRDGVLSAYAQ